MPDAQLNYCWRWPQRQQLEDYVADNSIKNVKFLGFFDDVTKVDLLHQATVYCSTAMFGESFGLCCWKPWLQARLRLPAAIPAMLLC
jgi:glycosyltransferase involved in cell wall biosynthesis